MRGSVAGGGGIAAGAAPGAGGKYECVWPGWAALAADALGRAGCEGEAARYFGFARRVVERDGSFLSYYRADGSPGPLLVPADGGVVGESAAGIQLEATGLTLYAAYRHFRRAVNFEDLQGFYDALVRPAAGHLAGYREPTGLPRPAWDVWGLRRGVTTLGCAAVWAGLDAAAGFAAVVGDVRGAEEFGAAAGEVREAALRHLWDEPAGRFLRMLVPGDEAAGVAPLRDATPDSALFGLHFLGFLPVDDGRLVATLEAVGDALMVHTRVGGLARFRGDYYHAITRDWDLVPGNPWPLVSCWLARWRIARAGGAAELAAALDSLEWVVRWAEPGLLLPQQLEPFAGGAIGVTPFVYGHAELVAAVQDYIERRDALAAGGRGLRNGDPAALNGTSSELEKGPGLGGAGSAVPVEGRGCMMAVESGYPECRKCDHGQMLPLSDYGRDGAPIKFKAWVCSNPECGFNIRIDNGEISFGRTIGQSYK